MATISVCVPERAKNEKKYALKALDNNCIGSVQVGDRSLHFIDMFEEKFAKYIGVKHAITTTSGTTALHLACKAVGVKKGDEVIVPDMTIISVSNAVFNCGAKPVFADADEATWCINPKEAAKRITKKTKAIIAVHAYGHPVDMDEILKIAKRNNLYVIEDVAVGLGGLYKNKKLGSIGDIACFSFYSNKMINIGEGGMVVTNNSALAKNCSRLKNLAFLDNPLKRFIHKEIGFNYRMKNIDAAIGLAQLEEVDKFIKSRIKNAKLYIKNLYGIPGITLPVEREWARNCYWMFGIIIDKKRFGMSSFELMKYLLDGTKVKTKIETRKFFYPLHKQPVPEYQALKEHDEMFPVSKRLWEDGLYLPSSNTLTKKEIEYICAMVRKASKERRGK
ncbi:MAG: DegT/DnrJ/EryC1/StrS family aminotransferase [Candidatus Omnitrophica bacterium]|nr:DegT/DnrJ/EryC1/StrS family aminotransferase [Candidatus Omnitrophota bacterium]